MSHRVESLATQSQTVSKILQEYFIPEANFTQFIHIMKNIFTHHAAKVINISIRHIPGDSESFLSYAPHNCFAFVCYIALENRPDAHAQALIWTRKLIDASIALQGKYYLPYHQFASPEQCMAAYPHYADLWVVKQKYDPTNHFQNSLINACNQALIADHSFLKSRPE